MNKYEELPINVRPDVSDFARLMEKALADNDGEKRGYGGGEFSAMYLKLGEEMGEVGAAILRSFITWEGQDRLYSHGAEKKINLLLELRNECADVANIAMMIANRADIFINNTHTSDHK